MALGSTLYNEKVRGIIFKKNFFLALLLLFYSFSSYGVKSIELYIYRNVQTFLLQVVYRNFFC